MSAPIVFDSIAISPFEELAAYEYLYSLDHATLKSMTKQTVLAKKLPSEALAEKVGLIKPEAIKDVEAFLQTKSGVFSIAINSTPSYPKKLRESERPTPLFYYLGDIGLLESPSISIVGARKASSDGLSRAARLARELIDYGFTIVSGLALGVDTSALRAAIGDNGSVIAVIGTPIDEYYPKENKQLQDFIANKHLLISQVPLYRYAHQSFQSKRYYFPERNELMAAVSDATVIVEASDTSGTLTQARACLGQGRPLFILRSCVENPALSWPKTLLLKSPDSVHILDTVEQVPEVLNRGNRIEDV